jgi:uncharacterized protein (UPF0335 family)
MITREQLEQYITKIERLETDKAAVLEDIKEVMAAAKSEGFDTKTMKQIIKMRRLDKNDLAEQEAMLDLYRSVLGI